VSDDVVEPKVTKRTLAEWRSALAKLREAERQQSIALPGETGRLLEVVGQALAQGDSAVPANDIAQIEKITRVEATYS
jgi:hypothetical protein